LDIIAPPSAAGGCGFALIIIAPAGAAGFGAALPAAPRLAATVTGGPYHEANCAWKFFSFGMSW